MERCGYVFQRCLYLSRLASCLMLPYAGTLHGEVAGGAGSCRGESLHLRPGFARTFSLSPDEIRKGQRAVLSWSVPNVAEVLIEKSEGSRNGLLTVGRFSSQGSLDVWPQDTTIYVISYGGAGTPCVRSVWVTVR